MVVESLSTKDKENLAQNLCDLTVPNTLVVCNRNGKLEFMNVYLSKNLASIEYKSNKSNKIKSVDIYNIKEITFGQHTNTFKKANRRDLANFSFSVYYLVTDTGIIDTLDLVPKNEDQFQQWTHHLQALVDFNKTGDGIPEDLMQLYLSKTPRISENDDNRGKNIKKEVYSFGWNDHGQVGDNTTISKSEPVLLDTLLGKSALKISSGWAHSILIVENGAIMQYGLNLATNGVEQDSIIIPTLIPELSPPIINEMHRIREISCGHFHTLALTENGDVFSWGSNSYGQLGLNDTIDRNKPKMIESLNNYRITEIACGGNFSLALTESMNNTNVWSWGYGKRGALGHQSNENILKPKSINDLEGLAIEKIDAGDHHSICVTKKQLFAWGDNQFGQLGLGDEDIRLRPTPIHSLVDCPILSLSCGAYHTVVLALIEKLNAKFIYSWGLNNHGQLGYETKSKFINKAIAVENINTIIKSPLLEVSCGYFHTILRDSDGDILSCGSNKYGQLGYETVNNTINRNSKFKYIEALKNKNASAINAGGEHTTVLTARAWVDDNDAKECMACKEKFTMYKRKHHCRNCLGIFLC